MVGPSTASKDQMVKQMKKDGQAALVGTFLRFWDLDLSTSLVWTQIANANL
eukprot:m.161552 g.161552  ORF g.161552 m.161552 type:complete len:51 (-) comp14580_c0_seq2:61-213(-)